MGSSEKRSKDIMSDIPTFSAENLQNNLKVIQNSRTFLSIIAGVLAGIIGFNGLTGFVFYFVVMLITSVGLMAKAGFSADLYFDSWNRVLFDGFLGGLMSFVLFWTYSERTSAAKEDGETTHKIEFGFAASSSN